MNKWLLSMILFLSFTVVLFINLQNNLEVGNQFSTNLEDVTNEEMEAVILENPNIFPMRVALANRYFDEVDYSNALPHYMYVAENSDENEIKSFALAQIAWMVFESGNTEVATNYLNESLNINNNSFNSSKERSFEFMTLIFFLKISKSFLVFKASGYLLL